MRMTVREGGRGRLVMAANAAALERYRMLRGAHSFSDPSAISLESPTAPFVPAG